MNELKKVEKRKPTSFSLSADTIAKLEEYARNHHTNKSQAVTDLIWNATNEDNLLQMGRAFCDEDDYWYEDEYFNAYIENAEEYIRDAPNQIVLVNDEYQENEGRYFDET